jgi:hypothetical protein
MFGVTGAAIATGAVAEAAPAVFEHKEVALGYTFDLKPPEGMTYQWKRIFITQDEPDLQNILDMVAHGWKPVPMSRHLEHFRPGTADSDVNVFSYWIEAGGLVLMEKPTADIPPPAKYPEPFPLESFNE